MTFLTTRFTNETLAENLRFRENNNVACIYNAIVPISDKHPYKDLYVLEMNNSTNKLVGVGIITKKIWPREPIYSDPSYNRYTYKGVKHIPVSLLPETMVQELEEKLFYGRGHLKRGKSFTQFPDKWLKPEYFEFMCKYNEIVN
jgi:hypothetical protein